MLPPIPSSVRAALQLAFLMDNNAVSEEDKAGVLRLEAHDTSTIEQANDVMQYEVTSAAASDLYARVGGDTSRIRGYVGKVLDHQSQDLYSANKETDSP
jgi:hypothetical protein